MPADITTENGKVRFNIGDTVEPYILEDVVIDTLLAKYPDDTEAVRIWKATIDALIIMKGRAAQLSERRREREGSVEVEVYSNLTYDSISDLLEYWKDNPPVIPKGYDLHIFGGVSKEEVQRVECDPDSNRPYPKIGGTHDSTGFEFIPNSFEST